MHRAGHSRLFRLWPVAAIVAVTAVLAAMLVPLAAQADTIALSGTVQNASGTKLAGVTVTAVGYVNGITESTVSTPSGAFAFPALFPGTYTLSFSATSTTFAQYLGNTSLLRNAEYMELFPGADNEDRSYVNATLSDSGTISGTVSKIPTGVLASYTVRAFSRNPNGSWSIARSAVTSSKGVYSLTGVEPGEYAVEAIDLTSAHPAYAPTFSGGVTSVDAATAVGVVANKATNYNFALGKAGSVSGSVVGLYNGTHTEAVPGTHVIVYRLDDYLTPFESATALDSPSATTSSSGAYSVSGLPPGHYTLEFEPPSTPTAVGAQLYGRSFLGTAPDRTDPLQADVLTIGNGTALTGRSITLVAPGQVTGTVEDASNDPLPNIRVSIDYAGRDEDLPSEHAASLRTDADGQFSFAGLGAGDYDLWVGSNVNPTSANEDLTWVRQVVQVSVTSANTTTAPVTMTKKGGANHSLYPTTFPSIETDDESVDGTASIQSNGVWTDPNLSPDDFTYEWLRDGKPIQFETNALYNFKPGDMGHEISANVTASDFGYGTRTFSTQTVGPIGPGTINGPSPAPTITGTNAVGHILTVTNGGYDQSGVVVRYDWQCYNASTGTWIDSGGPATPAHLVTTFDFEHGGTLRVAITASRDGYADNIAYATPGGFIGQGTLTMVTPPTIKKTSSSFSVVGGVWSPSAVNPVDPIDYDWNIYNPDGSQFATASTPVLPLTGTVGKYVTLRIEHNLEGYASTWSPEITAQLGDPAVASGATTITSSPTVGANMFAPMPTWAPISGSSTYQWQYKYKSTWKNAPGDSTQDFYSVAPTDLGRLYRVVTTRHATGLRDAVSVAQAPAAVALGSADGTLVAPVVSGTFGTGDTVSTTTGTWLQPGGVYSYQWVRTSNFEFGPDFAIPGATKSTFVIPQSLVGQYLFVRVTSKVAARHDGERNGYLPGNNQPTVVTDKLTQLTAATVTHVGNVYTVKGGTFTPSSTPGQTKYKWEYFNESTGLWVVATTAMPLPGVTSASLDLSTAGHDGARWGVVVTGAADGYNPTDAPIVAVANGAISHTGFVDLPPASTVNQPITPVQPAWSVPAPSLKYQWRLETTPSSGVWKNIVGATGPTFTPVGIYLNRELDVVEIASRAGYTSETVVSRATNANAAAAPSPGTSANAPSITGNNVVGSVLTGHPGTWNTTGLTFHYSWQVSTNGTSWTPVPGAITATYLIPLSAIATDFFQVTVTASKLGYENGTGTAATTATAGFGNVTEISAPKVTVKNGVYAVTTGTWKPAPVAYSYTWFVYDPATDAPTQFGPYSSNTFTPAPADATKKLVVQVGVQPPDYSPASASVIAHSGPKIVSSSPPALSGTPVVGGTLTAAFGTWSTPSPSVSAQWFANGVAVPSAGHGLTFTIGSAYLGKTISANFTVALYGYTTATYAATSAQVFSNLVLAPTVAPVIHGTPVVDGTLTVTPGTWNSPGLTFEYKWLRDGRPIPGATGTSYVVSSADAGQEITAGITASKKNYSPAEYRPDEITVDDGAAVSFTGSAVTVTNTPLLGNILTAKLGVFALPVTVQYSWLANNGAGWFLIAGATANTYTVSAADGIGTGSQIKVSILVERAGHTPEDLDSVPVTVGVSP